MPKSSYSSWSLKSEIFQCSPKSCQTFGLHLQEYMSPKTLKIAQSGHTGRSIIHSFLHTSINILSTILYLFWDVLAAEIGRHWAIFACYFAINYPSTKDFTSLSYEVLWENLCYAYISGTLIGSLANFIISECLKFQHSVNLCWKMVIG